VSRYGQQTDEGKGRGITSGVSPPLADPPSLREYEISSQSQYIRDIRSSRVPIQSHPYSTSKDFFTIGRVFATLWTEPPGGNSGKDNDSIVTDVSYATKVYLKIRRFIVVEERDESAICLPVTSYNGKGLTKRGVRRSDHGFIYVKNKPEKVDGMKSEPLKLDLSRGDATRIIDPTYVNYGKRYTVETNVKVKVKDIGILDTRSKSILLRYSRSPLPQMEDEPEELFRQRRSDSQGDPLSTDSKTDILPIPSVYSSSSAAYSDDDEDLWSDVGEEESFSETSDTPSFLEDSFRPVEYPNPVRKAILAPQSIQAQNNTAPARWVCPGGYGARHMHDKALFSLWKERERRFRAPTNDEKQWIFTTFDAVRVGRLGHYMWIETGNLPSPTPLTVACMPVLFVGVGEAPEELSPNAAHYSNPRLPDPCSHIKWPQLSNPKRAERSGVLAALHGIVNPRAVIYLPSYIVVELVHDDARIYEPASLPGTVAGHTTLYHHSEAHFFGAMKDLGRERRLNPADFPIPETGPLPEDCTNYLLGTDALFTPGVRIASGRGEPETSHENASFATTSGVWLRNMSGEYFMTVANHGFLSSREVYHPSEVENAMKIGDVAKSYPELDVAFVKLEPRVAEKVTNSVYFQAEPPKRLVNGDEIEQGSWSEVDGMSSGLVSLMSQGCVDYRPPRPSGHPEISFSQWRTWTISMIFGAAKPRIVAGMCGAPVVACKGGAVQGFFHLSDGHHAQCATLDDLTAEGWAIV
jgi:hypothetical protein